MKFKLNVTIMISCNYASYFKISIASRYRNNQPYQTQSSPNSLHQEVLGESESHSLLVESVINYNSNTLIIIFFSIAKDGKRRREHTHIESDRGTDRQMDGGDCLPSSLHELLPLLAQTHSLLIIIIYYYLLLFIY